jgi:hypothetical protein
MTPTVIQKSEGYAAVRYFGGRYKLYFAGILTLTMVNSIVDSIGVLAFSPMFTTLLWPVCRVLRRDAGVHQ